MKKAKMILFTLIMASLMIATVTLAQPLIGQSDAEQPSVDVVDGESETAGECRNKHKRPEPRRPLGLLVKFQHQNLTIEVLNELTGQDVDTISAELEFSHPSDILIAYEIDIETFIAAMDTRVTELVQSAVSNGTISTEQGDEIIIMIAEKPERPGSGEEEVPPRFEFTE